MITLSGRLITPGTSNAPTLLDMAVSLGRHPRFGGQTTRTWTVVLHSLVCERLMRYVKDDFLLRLYALTHDGHEFATCDVPSTWKNNDTRNQQWDLDIRIYRELHIPMPDYESEDWVSKVDHLAVVAEGKLYGPPGIVEWFGVEPTGLALDVVQEIGGKYQSPYNTDGPMAPAVQEFVNMANFLMGAWRATLHGNSSWVRKSPSEDSSTR